MMWSRFATLLSILATSYTINRPVQKIVLTQKGFAQFVQYDVETPPLREFTLCAWLRLHDLAGEQTVFSYIGSSSDRLLRVWVAAGGRRVRVALGARAAASTRVQLMPRAWHHVCLSYQSDYGAWALYLDSRLLFCQVSQNLQGYVLPGEGSIILGYGTSETGSPNGLEGEIFGATMILISTIERNFTMKRDPRYEQKLFRKNRIKVKVNRDNRYLILGDLQTDELRNNIHGTLTPPVFTKSENDKYSTTPFNVIESDDGFKYYSRNPKPVSTSSEIDVGIWNSQIENAPNSDLKMNNHSTGSRTHRNYPIVSEYETPPSVSTPTFGYSDSRSAIQKSIDNKMITKQYANIISDVEKPPLPEDKPQVYGQWTTSKFVGNVLKYLKSISFNKNKQPRGHPSTIPLMKFTDSYPYQTELKLTKIRPPVTFNKNIMKAKRILKKRDTQPPQINVQIIEPDLRNDILNSHSKTQPKVVEVTNRGENNQKERKRENKHAELLFSEESSQKNINHKPNHEIRPDSNDKSTPSFMPTEEYSISDGESNKTIINLYSKSFANGNKWHNVKTFNNDYTPRKIVMGSDGEIVTKTESDEVKRHPSIRIKYQHDNRKLISMRDDETIVKGRALAEEVSNQANENKDFISILKYNHGFLPGHNKRKQMIDKSGSVLKAAAVQTKNNANFYKQVKLGNALNEQYIIDGDVKQSRHSFLGGDDEIPDINRYRSDLESKNNNIPSSLGPTVCKNVELYDHVLYVQPDGSIDMSHILSPVREKNLGIEFILQNYKRCSMQDSILQNNPALLIEWNRTPVRLFGGAYPKKTKDLCGFF